MIRVTPATLPKRTSLHTASKESCTHSRVVDDVLTATGTKSGQLTCKECKAEFPDPMFQRPPH